MQCLCGCGRSVEASHTGRPRQYYSAACKQTAYRQRNTSVTKLSPVPVTKQPDILFYCGLNEKDWNHHPMEPGTHVCIAPVYGKSDTTKMVNRVYVPEQVTDVLVDSAAFSDKIELTNGVISKNARLSFEDALHRQVSHSWQYKYSERVTHIASYDLLIDETWQDGERSKIRWSRDAATYAVGETVAAAQYLSKQRKRLRHLFDHPVGLALSAQGVEVEQYVKCAEQVIDCMEEGDIFGLGGWCVTGLFRAEMMPCFREIMPEVIGVAARKGVKRAHIWGVIMPEALGHLLYLCMLYGIRFSTDSSGPCRYPIDGNWGYGSWRDSAYKSPQILASCKAKDANGNKAPTCPPNTCCRGLERCRHVRLTGEWLANFREREPDFYRPIVKSPYRQLSWMEVAS